MSRAGHVHNYSGLKRRTSSLKVVGFKPQLERLHFFFFCFAAENAPIPFSRWKLPIACKEHVSSGYCTIEFDQDNWSVLYK